MSSIILGDKEFLPYISGSTVEAAIERVARQVNECYEGLSEPLVLLTTLYGAMMFSAQLNKHLTMDVQWAFVKCSSYGLNSHSSGCVCFDIEPTIDVSQRQVLVLEDIVDTGGTWIALHNRLIDLGARGVRIATMTIKKEIYCATLPVDFIGLEVENKFIVGYGLDYAGRGRNLYGLYYAASC